LGHLKDSKFLEKSYLVSKNFENFFFKNLENFKIDLLMQEVFFFQKTKISMEFARGKRIQGARLDHTQYGLANVLVYHRIESSFRIWKKYFLFSKWKPR
jgi:hypothetical protein